MLLDQLGIYGWKEADENPLLASLLTGDPLLLIRNHGSAKQHLGATAPEAAGRIHSDLERGFIRAEVARWDELIEAGSIAALKRQGKLHTEGKTYEVQDGDVLNILFNL